MRLELLQVSGIHSAIYEAYYHQVDPAGSGVIQALDAARFLKKSRLSDVILSKIWDLSDPNGKGFLDKPGLFVALKLVALAQAGKEIHMTNIHSETPPPKIGELPKVPPGAAPARPAAPPPASAGEWAMKPAEREKYSQLFDSLQPSNGLIAGNKVKGVLMESKLPLDTLGKIWDLADQDKDGMLDRHEFLVAMHLVYKALEKHAVPTTLPPELRARPSRPPSPRAPPPPTAPAAVAAPAPQSNAMLLEGLLDFNSPPSNNTPVAAAPWVVPASDRARFAAQFVALDRDRDGLVSGAEIKQTLLDTHLPQNTLAHIWALCDSSSVGKLNENQFALAMWLVARAQRGVPPPAHLAPDMRPPPPGVAPGPPAQSVIAPSVPQQPEPVSLGPQPTPELEAIAREIDALVKERLTLETEVNARQRELTMQSSEADSLQSELDTLSATQKQLENQKGEAQKRLNDLKTQVEKLRSQVSAQESAASETEAEVLARRAAAQTLKERERGLQEDVSRAEAEAERLNAQLSRTVLANSQANIKIAHLEQQLTALTEASEALAAGAPTAAHLALQPGHTAEHLARLVRGTTPHDELEDDGFAEKSNGFAAHASGFEADPFTGDAFAAAPAHDPFAPASAAQGAFGSSAFANEADPFAGDAFASTDTNTAANDSSGWAADPFAVLHAPTRADPPAAHAPTPAHTPAPSLPPKKHKTPPPRPAPPRPSQPAKTDRAMDFTEDPFKDYRYEDPFNIQDPFADVTDSKKADPFNRPTSVAGFETDDFFGGNLNGFPKQEKASGRVSAPPVAYDPFNNKSEFRTTTGNNNDTWAAFPTDNWSADDAWADPPKNNSWGKTENSLGKTDNSWGKTESNWGKPDNNLGRSDSSWGKTDEWASKSKNDDWATKTDDWATEWSNNTDQNKNLNETWPSNTMPSKKEKSPRPVKLAKSLVHTIGGIGRTKHAKEKKDKTKISNSAGSSELLPSEEQQWAWAASESKRVQAENEARRRQEDAELQLALAISRQEK